MLTWLQPLFFLRRLSFPLANYKRNCARIPDDNPAAAAIEKGQEPDPASLRMAQERDYDSVPFNRHAGSS